MLALLIPLTLGTLLMRLHARLRCWRTAFLGATLACGVDVVLLTQVLSLLHALTPATVSFSWLLAALTGGIVIARSNVRLEPGPGKLRVVMAEIQSSTAARLFWSITAALAVLSVLLGIVALSAPPNTWDSMTYHMPRVAHWIENRNVEPYPTHILRQLSLGPGAEYVILHLQLLSGSDMLATLVQLASMLVAVVGVSLIAAELGGDRFSQLGAAVVAASLPIGILESTSTLTDAVAALWLVCVVLFALRLARAGDALPTLPLGAALGASLGMAVLTKATAYLYAFPFVLWVLTALIHARGWAALRPLLLVASLALTLNLGFYARNSLIFASPLGPADEGAPGYRYTNDLMSPALFASNVVRNVGLQFTVTPIQAVNTAAEQVVHGLHVWLGVDVADPRTTWGGEVFKAQPASAAFSENAASNPLQFVLLLASLVVAGVDRRVRRAPDLLFYAAAVGSGFVLFCLALRWQPWNSRLLLPLLVVSAPLVAVVLERSAPRLRNLVAVGLIVSMVPWVIHNQSRPLVGGRSVLHVNRQEQYFTQRPGLQAPYVEAMGILGDRGCTQIGLLTGSDDWEYPVWILLGQTGQTTGTPVQVEHVSVNNVSARWTSAEQARFRPCAVLSLLPGESGPLSVGGTQYVSRWWSAPVTILEPVDASR